MYLFTQKYRILLPLFGFVVGILLSEHMGNQWILIAGLAPIALITSAYLPSLGFLLFIPLGLLFTANPLLRSVENIENYIGKRINLEGTLYKSPETLNQRTKLFIDVEFVIEENTIKPVHGKVAISCGEVIPGLNRGDRLRIIDAKLKPIRNFNNPGRFDVERFYKRQGLYATGFVQDKNHTISFGRDSSYSPLLYSINETRLRFGRFVRKNFKAPENEIINAVTIGDRTGIPSKLRTEFSRTGVAHILAISGLHVGSVAFIFFQLIKWMLKRSEYLLLRFKVPRLAAALTILPVFLYTATAGFSTSACRALIMVSIYLASIVVGRSENKINTLGVAALIILILQPWALFQLSFQLSFASVLAILLAHKFYPFKFNTLKNTAWSLIKTTSAAAFATYPFIADSFGTLPLISIPANLLFIPIVEFFTVPLGLTSFAAFLISTHLAEPFISLNVFLIELLIIGISNIIKIPYSSLAVPELGRLNWVLFTLVGLAFMIQNIHPRFKYLFPALLVLFVASSAFSVINKSWNLGELKVNFLDVGKNKSSVFFNLPDGKTILINGGYSAKAQSGYAEKTTLSNFLISLGIERIDYLILTSIDKDHLEGAKHITERFTVRTLLTNGSKLDSELWEAVYEKGIKWKNLLQIDEPLPIGELRLGILKTGQGMRIQDSSMPYPIALKLSVRGLKFIIGEALNDKARQANLEERYGELLQCDVLYLPRLASENTLDKFMSSASPQMLLTNDFQTQNGLKTKGWKNANRGLQIMRIQNTGAVTFYTKRERLYYYTFSGGKGSVSKRN